NGHGREIRRRRQARGEVAHEQVAGRACPGQNDRDDGTRAGQPEPPAPARRRPIGIFDRLGHGAGSTTSTWPAAVLPLSSGRYMSSTVTPGREKLPGVVARTI